MEEWCKYVKRENEQYVKTVCIWMAMGIGRKFVDKEMKNDNDKHDNHYCSLKFLKQFFGT